MNNHASREARYRAAYYASPTYRRAMRRRVIGEAAAIAFIVLASVTVAAVGFWGLSVILGG